MKNFEKVRRGIETQLGVNGKRLARRMRKLETDDLLTLYEEGSNMFFHEKPLEKRSKGGMLLAASVRVLRERYEQIAELDLTKPFPLRDWFNGVPQKQAR